MMTTWKLAPALAAGCTIVLKPDSADAAVGAADGGARDRGRVSARDDQRRPGPGPDGRRHIVHHPGIEKVAFTGSTATGGEIMRLAADGDQAPDPRARRQEPEPRLRRRRTSRDAIPSSVWSIYYSAGQSCEARSRALVEQLDLRRFRRAVLRGGDEPQSGRSARGGDTGRLADLGVSIATRVDGYVEAGREEGAEVVAGGQAPEGKGAFYPPTVLAQVDNSMRVAQEEIFGPVVTVIPFEDEKDAVRIANDVRYGLMATVWTATPPAATGSRGGSRPGRSGSTCRTRPSRGSRSAATSSPASAASSASRRSSLPRDEERDRLHEPEAVQPVRPLSKNSAPPVSGGAP